MANRLNAESSKFVFLLKITEIGNIADTVGVYYALFPKFLNNDLVELQPFETYFVCSCGPTHSLNISWILTYPVIENNDIIDITSNPIVVELRYYKLDKKMVEGLSSNVSAISVKKKDLQLAGFFLINLQKFFNSTYDSYEDVISLRYPEAQIGMTIRTWPELPFIKYKIKLNKPIITENTLDIEKLTITFEYIVNPIDQMKDPDAEFEIGLKLIMPDKKFKEIHIERGKMRNQNKLPLNKMHWNLFNYQGPEIQTLDKLTNLSLSLEDFEISTAAECNVNENYFSKDIVCFQSEFDCYIPNDYIANWIDSTHQTIEVLMNVNSNLERFIGIIDLTKFLEVDVKRLRFLIPLFAFNQKVFQTYPANQVFFTKGSAGGGAGDGKKNDYEYLLNNENYSTCLIVEIQLEHPMIPRKIENFDDYECEEMNSDDEPLNSRCAELFQNTEKNMKFALRNFMNRFYENTPKMCSTKQIEERPLTVEEACVPAEKNLIAKSSDFASLNFNFDELKDLDYNDITEDIYILLLNKFYEFRMDGKADFYKFNCYRIKCALECRELGFEEEGPDFYLMNIQEDKFTKYDRYLEYAIYNLFIHDMAMALVCTKEALILNSTAYFSYLVQAYLFYTDREFVKCEAMLLQLIDDCDNFLEAWVALFCIYLADDKIPKMKDVETKIYRLYNKGLYQCQLHKLDDFLWFFKESSDPIANSLLRFIRWGFFQFAEIGLSYIIHQYKCDEALYQFPMALIDYYRKDYLNALQRLTVIRIDNTDILCNKSILIIHCLLEMKSLTAISELKRLLRYRDKLTKDILYLMYMKIGVYYFSNSKMKTAKYYLKQSCYHLGTYVSFRLLGMVTLKIQDGNFSESCFKMMYKINPNNCVCWPYLALIYQQKNFLTHFKVCHDMMNKCEVKDAKILEEIKTIENYLHLG